MSTYDLIAMGLQSGECLNSWGVRLSTMRVVTRFGGVGGRGGCGSTKLIEEDKRFSPIHNQTVTSNVGKGYMRREAGCGGELMRCVDEQAPIQG